MIPTMKTKTKIDPVIYLDAAMIIDDGEQEFSCCAICCYDDKRRFPKRYHARCVYEKIFDLEEYKQTFDFAQERVIALLLAAYVIERGDFK
jgi:hypothetical protein